MQAWLDSADFAAKLPPRNGCFLLTDELAEPMMRHLDGKTYLDPEQRAEANLPAYPTDWTARFAGSPRESRVPRTEEFVPLRDALCWDSLADGCSSVQCALLHPRHNGTPVCGKHLTSELVLWGRRRRPPCPGDCAKAHPTRDELEVALHDAIHEGSRLHVHLQSPPRLGCGVAQCARSLHVVPSDVSPAEADAALDARAPMALRVAVDVGFDGVMSESERKSLATQCGLCHGIASQAEHRPHVRHARVNPHMNYAVTP
jgi:cytochrome c553